MDLAAPSTEPRGARNRRLGLAALLGGMAVLHVVQPRPFVEMVPGWVPGDPETVNWLATAAEGGSALLLANRRTARLGGWAAFATFLGVFPANIDMAVNGVDIRRDDNGDVERVVGGVPDARNWIRLPFQFLFAALVWRHARRSG